MTNKVSIGDRNLRSEGENRPTRCSEPLLSKVGGPKRSSPCCAGWDRMDVVGLTSCIFQCCAEKLEEVVFLLMLFKKLCRGQSLQFSFLGNLT